MEIFYESITANLTKPSDRRRFCAYAAHRGLQFSTEGDPLKADVVVLSEGADLSKWIRIRKRNPRIVFDFIDSYFAEETMSLRPVFRGIAKFTFGRTRYLHWNYRKLLIDICRLADAVICTTNEQRMAISEFCPNVHIILDCQEADVLAIKTDYSSGACFNIIWEGLPVNLVTFRLLVPVLEQLQLRIPCALHLITDLHYPMGLGTLFPRPTQQLTRSLFGRVSHVYLYEWNQFLFAHLCKACDLAVIPLPLNMGQFVGKPANKLHLFWRIGLPVLTSPTPAYRIAMEEAGLDMTCDSPEEWLKKLEYYMQNPEVRKRAGQQGKLYADTRYSDEAMVRRWDAVFESIGFPVK